MKGVNGNILRVDLTTGKLTVQEISEDHYRRYLGGRGFIAHTLLTEVPKGIDPFGPENRLVFALGTTHRASLCGERAEQCRVQVPAFRGLRRIRGGRVLGGGVEKGRF